MSYVNFESRSIFIHVPKTAGGSMSLYPFVLEDEFGHEGISSLHELYGGTDVWSFFKWGFVRHPMDRLVSSYFWRRDHLEDKVPNSFGDFVRQLPDNQECQRRIHFRPMYTFFTVGGKMAVDFVGRFEQIDTDWRTVMERLNEVPKSLEYHERKRTDSKPWSEYYDKETASIVRQIYARDFELFGYK